MWMLAELDEDWEREEQRLFGAAFDGSRLSKMYRENIDEEAILSILKELLPRYAKEREEGEHFGDFLVRTGVIEATTDGTNFHK